MSLSERWKRCIIPLADKIVYASNAYVDLKSTINQMSDQLIDFSRPSVGPADDRLLQFAALIRPLTGDNLSLIRVGGHHDGGYVMASPLQADGALSIGIGTDVSWDQDVSSRGIRVEMFDPTIRRPPKRVRGGRFHRIGLAPIRSEYFLRLPELIRIAEFEPTDELLLKVDVEGDEWASLAELDPCALEQFSQIVIEFHGLSRLRDPSMAKQMLQALTVLASSHAPIHVHANNYESLVRFDRHWFANAIEVTYVRSDLIHRPRYVEEPRTDIDAPCDPRVEEIVLTSLLHLRPN